MKEIKIQKDHKLPYGYYYEKPIPADFSFHKTDEQITDTVKEPVMETETIVRADCNVNNIFLIVDIYPCSDIFPEMEGRGPIREKRLCQPHIRRVQTYIHQYFQEVLDEMIYGE